MAVSLSTLRKVKATFPPRTLIYGPPKMGKTTLASEFPGAVFIQTEQGENLDEITSFGKIDSWDDVIEAVRVLYREAHDLKTVVIDSIDRLENLIWAHTCAVHKWDSVPGVEYGKGYGAATVFWAQLFVGLNLLRTEKGMNVILIGHEEVDRFDDPRSASYSRFDFRLHKTAHAMIQNDMDIILFLNQKPGVQEEKIGFGGKRKVAAGTAQRWMHLEGRPSYNAGNRYNMPPEAPYVLGQGYAALSQFFPPNVTQEKALV
jgi:hypothetical protein